MHCQIRVGGHLDPARGERLAGLRISHEAAGTSLIDGKLPDQAALHGVLLGLIRLGLPLIALRTSESPSAGTVDDASG